MVGGAALQECLDSETVERVVLVNRRSLGRTHPKLTEIIHADFTDWSPIRDQLRGLNACFHCMGVSSVGISEADYERLTYTVTKNLADTLRAVSPATAFVYVSGQGTTGDSRMHWAKTKAKAEDYILRAGFRDAYAFRPGFILPEKGIRSSTWWYNAIYTVMRPFYPLFRRMKGSTTTTEIGQAMIRVVSVGASQKVLEGADISRIGSAEH